MKPDPEYVARCAQASQLGLAALGEQLDRSYKRLQGHLRELEELLKARPPESLQVIERNSLKGRVVSKEKLSGETALELFGAETLAYLISQAGLFGPNAPHELHLNDRSAWFQVKSITWETPKKPKKAK